MHFHVQVGGRYQCRVRHGDGRPDTLTPWFDNLITNTGLDLIGTGFSVRLWVGTGSTAPAVTDTAMAGTILGSVTNAVTSGGSQLSSQPYYWYGRRVFTFAMGAVVGVVREVGIGAGTAGAVTSLFSRSRLKDAYGNDYDLTLTATDQLEVTYDLRSYLPVWNSAADDVVTTVEIAGVSRTCRCRPLYITRSIWGPLLGGSMVPYTGGTGAKSGAFNAALQAPNSTASLAGFSSGSSTAAAAYVPSSFRREFTITWLPATGNLTFNGFAAISDASGFFSSAFGASYQISFDPSISKTNLQTLTLTAFWSWSRYA